MLSVQRTTASGAALAENSWANMTSASDPGFRIYLSILTYPAAAISHPRPTQMQSPDAAHCQPQRRPQTPAAMCNSACSRSSASRDRVRHRGTRRTHSGAPLRLVVHSGDARLHL